MLNLDCVHPEWSPIVNEALLQVDQDYLANLDQTKEWLPGVDNIFNAFSLPLRETRYILFGESPYPRKESANGYAFWDANVQMLWNPTGLDKAVNRATSLRNFIKMLLLSENLLQANNLSQAAIANIPKQFLIDNLNELFKRLLSSGFLLLNASLVLSDKPVRQDAKVWQPFMASILKQCYERHPKITLILFGKIAEQINQIPIASQFNQFSCEHPYNLSFIKNPRVNEFFRPFHLLLKERAES